MFSDLLENNDFESRIYFYMRFCFLLQNSALLEVVVPMKEELKFIMMVCGEQFVTIHLMM